MLPSIKLDSPPHCGKFHCSFERVNGTRSDEVHKKEKRAGTSSSNPFFISPVSFPATRGSYQIPAVLLHTSHPHRVMLSALLLPLALTASAYAQQTEAQEVAALREAPAAVDRIKILNQDSDVSTEIRPTREFNE